ncbi:pseudouridine synthase, RluA family [sediment metagenome]|uniref:Pseudouridine synthase, RluA family n=1 Tax=sediment metagenome TaxID=749907 RepID=D9PKR0_9ZZZZ
MNDIPIIYEDETIIVVNKPAGLAVHEDGRTQKPTLTEWVRETHPNMVGVGEEMCLQNGIVIDRPGVVHRIDRDTSGILVLAKTQDVFLCLKQQFQARTVEKEYRAFVWGEMKVANGTIDRPIGRSRKDFRLWSASNIAGTKVRPAVTRYSLLTSYSGISYLSLEPKTGRTHQLRVHMKSIGHPVVCDTRYAPARPSALGFTRLALHAHALSFTHPNGTRLVLMAPLPEDFLNGERALGYCEHDMDSV